MVFGVVDRGGFTDDVENGVVVLTAAGHAVDDHVRDRQVCGAERRFGLGLLRLSSFDLVGQIACLVQQLRTLVGRRLAHLSADNLLVAAQ